MSLNYGKLAGAIIFVGSVQFLILLIVAEAVYPHYSVSGNYISDLGVGPSAWVFNSSVFVLGLAIVVGAYLTWRGLRPVLFFVLLVLAGVGAMGVGLFTEDVRILHGIFSLIVFLFGGLAAIASYRLQKPPLSYFAVVLGVMTLVALALFVSGNDLGLGMGGIERMVAYPTLLWGVGFSGYLMGSFGEAAKPSK